MADPQGWVNNPPNVLVKVVNTSRDELNDQLGLVVHYLSDRSRYVIHLAVKQEQVSLKPENLIKASLWEQAVGQYQFITHNAEVRRQASTAYARLQANLPARVKPEYVGVALLVLVIALFYFEGFTKTMMIISFIMLVGIVLAPDILSGASLQTAVRNSPSRFRELVRQHFPFGIGEKIAANQYLTALLAAFMIFLFVNALFSSGKVARPAPANSPSFLSSLFEGGSSSSPSVALTRAEMEQYYKLGFDDASAEKAFGTSLPKPVLDAASIGAVATDERRPLPAAVSDEWSTGSDYPLLDVPPPKSSNSIWGKLGHFFSAFYVIRTLYDLGRQPDGSWSYMNMLTNLRTLDTWKLGLLGFSVYRLVSGVMGN